MPRAHAILIGTGARHDLDLPNLPAVANNLADPRAALTDPDYGAFAADRCPVITAFATRDTAWLAGNSTSCTYR